VGDQPQAELPEFWLQVREEREKIQESCYLLATYWHLVSKYGDLKNKILEILEINKCSLHSILCLCFVAEHGGLVILVPPFSSSSELSDTYHTASLKNRG